jgi:peptidoglycan/LPS O-acetylase OafA/YrhL
VDPALALLLILAAAAVVVAALALALVFWLLYRRERTRAEDERTARRTCEAELGMVLVGAAEQASRVETVEREVAGLRAAVAAIVVVAETKRGKSGPS